MKDRCKVHNKAPFRLNRLSNISNMQANDKNGSTEWKISARNILSVLLSGNCLVVVDSSFFLELLEFISAYWIFVINNHIIGRGEFIGKVSEDL